MLESISGTYAFEVARWEASMPGRWRGRGLLCQAGGAAAGTNRRTLTVPRVLAIRAICAIWVSQGKPLNPLLYVLYVLYGSHKASH